MLMRAILGSALAALCLCSFNATTAQAQICGLDQGYGFGVGLQNNYVNATRLLAPHDRPPHFALYPPVYYSDVITPRPYGISPFAAPPGIRPVELDMLVAPEPEMIENPYFEQEQVDPIDPPETSPSDQTPEASPPTTEASHRGSKEPRAKKSTVEFIDNPFYVGNSVAQNG